MIFAMFRVGALAFYHHDSGWCHGKPDRLTWDVVLRAVQLGLIERMEHSSHYSKLRMVPVEDILNGK